MSDCIFCNIAQGELDTTLLYEDERVVAFDDLEPQAPHHVLIIPRQHIATINDTTEADAALLGHIIQVAKQMANERGIAGEGYRLLWNCNVNGGQAVFHIHLHLLGGRPMAWPPG